MDSPSVKDTKKHIKRVSELISYVCTKLKNRGTNHDASKLVEPEVSYFEKYTTTLKDVEYNSKEYKECLKQLEPALKHHYQQNDHHPEHYTNDIEGMSLCSLIEMLSDWKASTERSKNGDIKNSIKVNQERFGYSDELKQILLNTVKELHW